ncbi:antifungal protein ginkbilobin-like protein [Punica granatum]|uniref:Antifungal protein ginkbilobin-like protein n=1 Tax=Punica granatum TaxID=22663 RepID=A0A6P8E6N7_PUNGR|nr:antifungal protein ginkbilobin-like protein [Punica granatum]
MVALKVFAFAMVLLTSTLGIDPTNAKPDTIMTDWRCNGDLYKKGDPFADPYVLDDMVKETANSTGYNYYTKSPFSSLVAYGQVTCNRKLLYSDCVTCIMSARDHEQIFCYMSVGGQVILGDCTMKYEQYSFTDN